MSMCRSLVKLFLYLLIMHETNGLKCFSCKGEDECTNPATVDCNAKAVKNETQRFRALLADMSQLQYTGTEFKCYTFEVINRNMKLYGCTYANQDPCQLETREMLDISHCVFCNTDHCNNPHCDPDEDDNCPAKDYYAVFNDLEDFEGGFVKEASSAVSGRINKTWRSFLLLQSINWLTLSESFI